MDYRELDEDELAIMESLLTSSEENLMGLYRVLDAETHILKVLEKYNEQSTVKIDKALQIMVLVLGDGAVGRCLKYYDDICVKAFKLRKLDVEFKFWALCIEPLGIPDF